jgi:hypothetical protein
MAAFLSPTWIAELDAAAGSTALPPDVGDLTVELVVRGVPDAGEVRYHVRFAHGGLRVVPGAVESPDVRILSDYETAVAMHRVELSAQEAIARGRAKLQGPIQGVRGREAALRGLGDAFASVRAATTYT